MGFTKFRVTVGTSLCTTAQHISSKIKAFLHHLCWVILILNYAIPYLTPLSLTYPEVRFPWSTQKSQYFFSSQNVFDCQKWLSKFVQSIDIMTIFWFLNIFFSNSNAPSIQGHFKLSFYSMRQRNPKDYIWSWCRSTGQIGTLGTFDLVLLVLQ